MWEIAQSRVNCPRIINSPGRLEEEERRDLLCRTVGQTCKPDEEEQKEVTLKEGQANTNPHRSQMP